MSLQREFSNNSKVFQHFTRLEMNIYALWKNGHSVEYIAQRLNLALSTVRFYLKNIEAKAGS